MENDEFEAMFLAAGLPEDQIDEVLAYFHAFGGACKITSVADYETAKSTYAVMDAYLDPDDTYSPVGRYLVSLGGRIVAWEDKAAKLSP